MMGAVSCCHMHRHSGWRRLALVVLLQVLLHGSAWVGLVDAQAGRTECVPSATTFCFSHDMYSSDTGYYRVQGYESTAPDLEVQVGQTYTFDQSDETNWFHPIGFAYYPDGAHNGRIEVLDDSTPGRAAGGPGTCDDVLCEDGACADWCSGRSRTACEAGCDSAGSVQYKIDDGWTGSWTDVGLASNTGTDVTVFVPGYEPEFFIPKKQWTSKHYKVELTITPEILARAVGGQLFYFCHIHTRMSGRLVIVGPGYVAERGPPPALYDTYVPQPFDAECGTFEATDFATSGSNSCAGEMLCGEGATEESTFIRCLKAINCKMKHEMRVDSAQDELALFMHQMIPHHANAVNMAKILMKESDARRESDPEGPDYLGRELSDMLYTIVNSQNYQIHQMEAYLADMNNPRGTALCDVYEARASPARAMQVGQSELLSDGNDHSLPTAPQNLQDRLLYVRHQLFSNANAGHFVIVDTQELTQISSPDDAGDVAPTLVVAMGESYTFDQSHHTNWFHPLNFNPSPVSPTGDVSEMVPPAVRDAVSYSIDDNPTTRQDYTTRFT